MFKYADDTYLVVPAANSSLCVPEIAHIEVWAASNNLKLNYSKSKEIVFTARGKRGKTALPPPPCHNIERVSSHRVLGVILNNRLTATDHIDQLLSSCSSLLYALRVLRSHGVPSTSLQDVFRATVVAKIIYCAPAWAGICSAADRLRLDRFLNRCKRTGFCATDLPSVTELYNDADDALFETIMSNSAHTLQPYLPERHELTYNLRERSHNRSLITKTMDLTDRDFIIRMLYKSSY